MLDVPVLLAAVAPDSPCGEDLEYDAAFLELERIAQGQPERQMGDAVLPAEPPEWPRVRALACELFGRSKDLRVANLLLQGNVALDGLDGLAEGLLLVRELLDQYWDGVYPLLDADDDNDPTFRINALTGLVAEPLLQLVWAIPLVRSRAFGPVNLRAALNAAGLQRFASETLSPEQIAGAFADADADALAATRRALEGAQEHALAIEGGVAERVGSAQGLDLAPFANCFARPSRCSTCTARRAPAHPSCRAPKRPLPKSPAQRLSPPPCRQRAPAARSATARMSCASSTACSSITFATSHRARCRCCSSAPRRW